MDGLHAVPVRRGTPFTRLRRIVHRRTEDPADRLVLLGEALDRVRAARRDGETVLSALDRGFRDGMRSAGAAGRWQRGTEPRLVEIAEAYLAPDEARLAADLTVRHILARPDRYRGERFDGYVQTHLRRVIRDIVSRGSEHAETMAPH